MNYGPDTIDIKDIGMQAEPIQNGGILIPEEAQRRIQEESQRYISIPEEEDRPRKRAAPKCTSCGVQGHTRVSCNSK